MNYYNEKMNESHGRTKIWFARTRGNDLFLIIIIIFIFNFIYNFALLDT